MIRSSMKDLAINIEGLTKSFGQNFVLRGLDLQLSWGETLVVLGPNGSGKTTLIKIMSTLTKADNGVITIAGFDRDDMGQQIRQVIGVLVHDPMLYEDLSGYENLKFFGQLFGLNDVEDRIVSIADDLGVSPWLSKRVGTLSHGLKKRIAIVRVLLHNPQILLMDEPETGLDQEAVSILDGIIESRVNDGKSVLITTHNFDRGLSIGDRLAILSQGEIPYQAEVNSVSGVDSLKGIYSRFTGLKL